MGKNIKAYRVTGTITMQVEIEVDATSAAEAIETATEELQDSYNLTDSSLFHNINNDVDINLESYEYEDEDNDDFDA